MAEKYGITLEDIDTLAQPGQMQAGSDRVLGEIVEARRLYPGMDVRRELENPKLRQLLQSGVDLRTAYEVVHRDEILPAAMQAAARAVEKKLTGSAAVSRVAESAMESPGAALVKTDVAAMTRQQRADIIRRAAKGEVIRF